MPRGALDPPLMARAGLFPADIAEPQDPDVLKIVENAFSRLEPGDSLTVQRHPREPGKSEYTITLTQFHA